jgi:hypothetical protein
VTTPGIFNLREVRFDDGLRLPDLGLRQPDAGCQVYLRGEPELCLSVRVRHMDMNAFLLSGEEEQPELTIADNRWRHARTLADELDRQA